MMRVTVRSGDKGINWGARGGERVAQNVLNLVNTYRYEVAYNRTLGIDPAVLDSPADYAQAQLQAEIRELVARYEPRARVREVRCKGTAAGDFEIEVVIEV